MKVQNLKLTQNSAPPKKIRAAKKLHQIKLCNISVFYNYVKRISAFIWYYNNE